MRTVLLGFLLAMGSIGACGNTSSSSPPSSTDGGGNAVSDSGAAEVLAQNDAATREASVPPEPASGTVGGHSFTFAHGIAYPKSVDNNVDGYEIFLSDHAIDCAHATLEGSTTVDLDVAGTPPVAKSYPIVDPGALGPADVASDFNAYDGTCGSLRSDASKSGTLVLTKFDATNVEGTVEVTFQSKQGGDDGKVTGAFQATVCPKFPALTCTPH